MDSKFLHFVSTFPAMIILNGQNLGTLENNLDTISVETNTSDNLFLSVLPINEHKVALSIPYIVKICVNQNNINSNSKYVEINDFKNNHFEIKLNPINVLENQKQKLIKSLDVENIQINLYDDGTQKLEIITEDKIYNYKLSEKITNLNCEFFEENNTKFLFIKGKNTKNQDFLIVFNNFFCNLEIYGDVIETTHQTIQVLNNQDDIAKHGIVQKYKLSDNKFIFDDEYIVFLDGDPQKTTDPKIIPWAFSEAINIGDIKLARSYLDSNLNLILDDEHLLSFFGDYEEIRWNNYNDTQDTLCFLYNSPKQTKIYKFEIKNNKITNIFLLD